MEEEQAAGEDGMDDEDEAGLPGQGPTMKVLKGLGLGYLEDFTFPRAAELLNLRHKQCCSR